MPQLPTILFVPGAWHKPTCYNKVISILESQYKLKCISITLPSTLGSPEATFKDDLDTAVAVISSETSQGRDVVVVAHSYGGMIGNSAIKGFARASSPNSTSKQPQHTGHVLALVLITSGFSFTGVAFMDPFFGHPPPSWRINRATGFADLVVSPRKLFYHDLPAEEAEYWSSEITTQSLQALFGGREFVYSGWKDVPTWYISASEDKAFPVFGQRMQVGMARAMDGVAEHREVRSSHSPFLSVPYETVEVLLEAVEKVTGEVVRTGREEKTKAGVVVPVVSIWRPGLWLRYGLPFVFGHGVGRFIVFIQWARRLWKS